MILRTARPLGYCGSSKDGAWAAFLPTQATVDSPRGYISQPAHAALAGRLAAALNGHIFADVPEEILEAIAGHDVGWAEVDLAALEEAERDEPRSFISTAPAIAVGAWRRSIDDANSKSALSAFVVRSHFCLLAPQDGGIEHEQFRKDQEAELSLIGLIPQYNPQDLDRFVAFLGFCDLLSLHLCSGWSTEFELPLAHPAHSLARDSSGIHISIQEDLLQIEGVRAVDDKGVYVNGWEKTQSGRLRGRRYQWIFGQ